MLYYEKKEIDMFVVTKELQEVIDSFKQTLRILKNPKELLEASAVFACFIVVYFILIILADVLQCS